MSSTSLSRTAVGRRAGFAQGLLLLLGSCMPVMGSVLITPVLPQLSEHFAAAPGVEILVPMIVALPALMIAVFAPVAGQIADRVGRKRLLVAALFVYAVVGTVPAWLDDLGGILASRALVGLTEAAIMTVCTTLIIDYFQGERRAKVIGLQTVATTIGATLFIAIGGALGAGGWHAPFWVYSASILIAVPMLFVLWEPTAEERMLGENAGTRVRIPWRRIATALVVTVFAGFSFYVVILEVSYLVVAAGVPAERTGVIGGVSAVASLATAIGGLLFTRISKLGPGRLLPLALFAQAVGMVVIWAVPSLAGVIAGAIIASFGSGMVLPSLFLWFIAHITPEVRGRVTGLVMTAFYLGQFVTPILIGVLTGVVAGATGVAALSVAVGLVGVAAAIVGVAVAIGLRHGVRSTVAPSVAV
ncbi:MFS transporter [Microbacterium sp. SORGH_AS_0888]|uniref:MFS transporter n=1 Tax=Microbacterium sp. SORGH_AS_0888 TaxID=3041791 RepID=UPI00277FF6B8|nr:MFS transporter [Microbacterium sp. SORGH_AS_0888]MDQ1129631.1 MFS family permease [Microbacterium sp. SORGH_AS_0888]